MLLAEPEKIYRCY